MNNSSFHPKRRRQSLLPLVTSLMAAVLINGCSTQIKPSSHSTEPAPQQASPIAAPSPEQTPSTQSSSTAPPDLGSIKQAPAFANARAKKQHFFAMMYPIVHAENKRIQQQRKHILQLQHQRHLSPKEERKLQQLARQYGLTAPSSPDKALWSELLKRVDIVPVELALVQAANESAWGTSYFALNGNNYFGQWCFQKGCGLVPRQRSRGASHEVRRFKHAAESVQAYMRNINTSKAYRDLRNIRSQLRRRHIPIHAIILAKGLRHYSERGMAYVKTIRAMIRSNKKLIHQAAVKHSASG